MSTEKKQDRPDFITIRMSAAGKRMAGEHGVIGWANGRRHFDFRADETTEVERSYEWNHLLRHEMFESEPMFEEAADEISEAAAVAVASVPAEDEVEESN